VKIIKMVHRVAVVDKDLCQSRKCGLECIKECPVNINGKECIVLDENAKALISEELCIGCGICIKVCPFDAIEIVNLSEELKEDKIHQYGVNSFRLFRMPVVREGNVIGLVGRNGTGKSTALKILSGTIIPNLGDYESEPTWDKLLSYLKGREMKSYFQKLSDGEMRISIKPQEVYRIAEVWHGDSGSLLKKMDERREFDYIVERLGLNNSLTKRIDELSGGEIQRIAIAACWLRDADVYLFDEPSSYNDVRERLEVSKLIRELADRGRAVLVVEHDIAFLDYVTDYVQVIYGEPGVYGIVSSLYSSRTGINALIEGYLPVENVRFRENSVRFAERTITEPLTSNEVHIRYTTLAKKYDNFSMIAEGGYVKKGTVLGIIGANSLGKTTFLKIISGVERPDRGDVSSSTKIAYKPQYLTSQFSGTVEEFLLKLGKGYEDQVLQEAVVRPLRIEKLLSRNVSNLSGGELQKIAIIATLSQQVDVYALDEPSAFLDVEDRFVIARGISRIVKTYGKSALVIDHDLQLIDTISDMVIVFRGEPGKSGNASQPLAKEEALNLFLSDIGLTYRRDVNTGRPRVNKPGSKLDRRQKEMGRFYYKED
jgi:ATP-binding cassette subfamily E protein 1